MVWQTFATTYENKEEYCKITAAIEELKIRSENGDVTLLGSCDTENKGVVIFGASDYCIIRDFLERKEIRSEYY